MTYRDAKLACVPLGPGRTNNRWPSDGSFRELGVRRLAACVENGHGRELREGQAERNERHARHHNNAGHRWFTGVEAESLRQYEIWP
jgi:hypothetical protein